MPLFLADPNVQLALYGLATLAVGWAARHFGGAPTKPTTPAPTPTPSVPATPSVLDGILPDVLSFIQLLLQRQQAAKGSAVLANLLDHNASSIPLPVPPSAVQAAIAAATSQQPAPATA
jgi:hypothetical protein